MESVNDAALWGFAQSNGYAIVTKDSDFVELSALRGMSPKVIWLNLGNVSNTVVQDKLVEHLTTIQSFLDSDRDGVLEIE